jgi:hypothetical protein
VIKLNEECRSSRNTAETIIDRDEPFWNRHPAKALLEQDVKVAMPTN